MPRKRITWALLVALVFGALTACGSSTGTTPTGGTNGPPAVTTSSPGY